MHTELKKLSTASIEIYKKELITRSYKKTIKRKYDILLLVKKKLPKWETNLAWETH